MKKNKYNLMKLYYSTRNLKKLNTKVEFFCRLKFIEIKSDQIHGFESIELLTKT